MSEELAIIGSFLQRQARIIEPAPLAQLPAPVQPAQAHNPDEIRAIDAAFTHNQDKTDHIIGLMGLWLSSPWLGDVLADHFRKPADEEDEVPHGPKIDEGPEDE
jgi:hypothetical protein